MTWEHGRELATISDGTTTWTNTYNADGLRTKRTNGTKTYEYVYLGDKLIQMHVGDDVLKFGYDASGSPMYLQFNNSRYFYATNVQGDVTALVHTSGTAVVEYTYDAWGNILTTTGSMASTLGQVNPLRYRGYVYDTETKLYYLQSRYYDPNIGRFINADALVSTGQGILGNNMFAYCGNNPVLYKDTSGQIYSICISDDPTLSLCGIKGGGVGGIFGSAYAHQYAKDANGSYMLEEKYGSQYGAIVHQQLLLMEYDLLSINNDGVSVLDASIALLKRSYSWGDNFTVIPVDYFGAEASAGLTYSEGLHFSALIYTAAATGTFSIGPFEISATGYLGAIGAEFAVGMNGITIGGAPNGVGGSISIKWDYN